MITFFLILALIVAVAAVIFALQNTAPVTVTFFIWHFKDQPLALILLLALAAGVLIGLLTTSPGSIRSKWRASGQRKKIDGLEKILQETKLLLEQAKLDIAALREKPEAPAVIAAPAPPVEPSPPVEPVPPAEPVPPIEPAPPSEQPPED